jgi:hypothetical protein
MMKAARFSPPSRAGHDQQSGSDERGAQPRGFEAEHG